jgi:hypothetical protein
VWSIDLAAASAVEVDTKPEAAAKADADRRNESVRKLAMRGVAFAALPSGLRPSREDIPPDLLGPAPEPALPDVAQAREKAASVLAGLHFLADPDAGFLDFAERKVIAGAEEVLRAARKRWDGG